MARTLNKVLLIGRLGADPEFRYTTTGMPVATFPIATNRQWVGKDGNLQEQTEWHNIVAWDRLAQICADHLTRGRLVFIEGRLQTRSWEVNGQKVYRTEVVASDMLILDSKGTPAGEPVAAAVEVGPVAIGKEGAATAGTGAAGTIQSLSDDRAPATGLREASIEAASLEATDWDDPEDLPF
jgi:single-strand DNA-binding protein